MKENLLFNKNIAKNENKTISVRGAAIFGTISGIGIYYFFHFSFLSSVAFVFFNFELFYLLHSLGKTIPIRSFFCVLYGLNFLASPALMYNGFEELQPLAYAMKVPEDIYFAYALPAFLFFRIGLFIKSNQHQGEWVDSKKIAAIDNIFGIAIQCIVVGFFSSLISPFIPGGTNFIFYLLAQLKFFGLFLLIFSGQSLKNYWLIIIYGSIVISSFLGGMFHDLMIWFVYIGAVYCIKLKPITLLKVSGLVVFIIFAIFIQSIKAGWREKTWDENQSASIELLGDVSSDISKSNGGYFSKENLGPQLSRINQGWILASTMNNVPASVPFANGGVLKSYLIAVFVPKFLAPDKLGFGDTQTFNTYSGHTISGGTSMSLGSMADGYLNFGINGGIIFMFFFGLIFNLILKYLGKKSIQYPYLPLLSVILFTYPIRPDVNLSIVIGFVFKALIFVYLVYRVIERGRGFRERFKLALLQKNAGRSS